MECDGVGTPTVLLISGKGNRADTWSTSLVDSRKPEATVFRQAAQFTRVCAYDRPLTIGVNGEPSRSDPVPEPVTAKDGVADLHALLTAAQVQGPYVIVGHSYGGLIAQALCQHLRGRGCRSRPGRCSVRRAVRRTHGSTAGSLGKDQPGAGTRRHREFLCAGDFSASCAHDADGHSDRGLVAHQRAGRRQRRVSAERDG